MALRSRLRVVFVGDLYGGFDNMKFKCIRPIGKLVRGKIYEGFKTDQHTAAIFILDSTIKRVSFVKMQQNSKIKYLVEVKE